MSWIDAKENPVPKKKGAKCDMFVVIDLSDCIYMMYFFYEEDKWTRQGDDTQKIKYYMPIPPLPKGKEVIKKECE